MDINDNIAEAQQSAVEDFGMTLVRDNTPPPVVGMSGEIKFTDKFDRTLMVDATYFDDKFAFLNETGQHVFFHVEDRDTKVSGTVRLDRDGFRRLHSFLGVLLDGINE